MKIIKQVDWTYTLYEDEQGQYLLEVVVPAPQGAWASYEKRVHITRGERKKIDASPSFLDSIVREVFAGKRS